MNRNGILKSVAKSLLEASYEIQRLRVLTEYPVLDSVTQTAQKIEDAKQAVRELYLNYKWDE